eukprot:scaffold2612_cov267-Chaetoceros_neogracile.AAC.84
MPLPSSPGEIQAWSEAESRLGNRKTSAVFRKGRRKSVASVEIEAWSNFDTLSRPARQFQGRHQHMSARRIDSVEHPQKQGKTDLIRVSNIVFKRDDDHDIEETEALIMDPTKEQSSEDILIDTLHSTDGAEDAVDRQDEEKGIFAVYFDDESFGNSTYGKERAGLYSLFNGTISWLPSAIDQTLPVPWLFSFLEWNLRSIGQVFFCNSPGTGLFILTGLFVQSITVATYGTLGLITGNIVAVILGFDRGLISSGLFGYNSVLCGLAIGTFHGEYDLYPIFATICVSILSVIFFVAMGKLLSIYKSPPLTLPFNVATHMFLIGVSIMRNVSMTPVGEPALPEFNDAPYQDLIGPREFFFGTLRGIGQVFLANDVVCCALILGGIAVCSRYLAFAAFVGSLLGNGISVLAGADNDMIEQGLCGYNSSLTLAAIALFYVPSFGSFVLGSMAVVFTVLAQFACSILFMPYGLPVMTVPFCIITLAMILVQGTTDIIISVPLASITIPEEHLRRVNMLKEGFYLLLQAIKAIEDKGTRKLAKKERTTRLLRQASTTIVAKFNHEKLVEIQSDEIGRLALLTFHRIDVENQGFVSSKQFKEYLQSIDFNEMSGLQFVEQAFTLMDFDDNKTLEMKEFIAFVRVSAILGVMKDTVRTFFEFVDADGNGEVEFDELNAALSYLEQPALNDNECRILSRVSGGKDSFYVEDIVSFVTMSALKRTIDDIQESYTAA